MATSKIKKGDTVKVIAGKDKGREGKVTSVKDTEKGEERLHGEMDRLTAQMNDYQRLLKGGDKPCELTDGTRSGN